MSTSIESIAQQHGFSSDAVKTAWDALRRGGGSMAQFNHPELGGGGQWLPGMLMIGDMFNQNLKGRVDALFRDLQNAPIDPPSAPSTGRDAWQSHSADGGTSLSYGSAPTQTGTWYPSDLGVPSTSGSQNNVRYAWFPETRILAIELFGRVTLYDTAAHVISGISQGQANDAGSITFTSQLGVIPLSSLRVVS